MFRSSRAARIAGLVAVAALVLGAGGWWYRTTRPAYRLARGQAAARAGDFAEAEQYAAVLEQTGEKDRGLLLRGEILFLQKEPALALSTLARIKGEGEIRVEGALLCGRCLFVMRNLKQAEDALNFVLNANPNHAEATRLLGALCYDQGNFLRAIDLLKRAADLDPKDARSLLLVGQMHKDLEESKDAVAAYQEAFSRNANQPDLAGLRRDYAACLLKEFRNEDVLHELQSDTSPDAVNLRVEAMISLGQAAEATILLDEAIKAAPTHGGLLRLRAQIYQGANDPAAAARLLEHAVKVYRHDHRSRAMLAQCYTTLGMKTEAYEQIEQLKVSRKLIDEMHELQAEAMKNPWDPRPRYRLAEVSMQLDRPELAKMWTKAAEACKATK